jgi:hypothetical protein
MSRHLIRAAVFAAGFTLIVVATAFARPQVVRIGNLYLRDDGGISPTKLPRHRQAPISANLKARIGTTDGSHPPAVRKLTVDIDRTIRMNVEGLPVCRRGRLEARTTAAAKSACPGAIVGSGEGEVEVAFPESAPFSAKGPILLFNGGAHGGTTLVLIHTYVAVPVPTAITATVRITRIHRGHFGLHTITRVPEIAGEAGSVTGFKLRINRKFTFKARRHSYLTARCPTGRYFTDGKVLFTDGAELGLTHALPCTPIG